VQQEAVAGQEVEMLADRRLGQIRSKLLAAILAIKLADRDNSIHNRSQDQSTYLPATESSFYH
jgi:hypothetical protein